MTELDRFIFKRIIMDTVNAQCVLTDSMDVIECLRELSSELKEERKRQRREAN